MSTLRATLKLTYSWSAYRAATPQSRTMATLPDIKVLTSVNAMREWRQGHIARTIGFVPTMGALHGMVVSHYSPISQIF